MQDARVFSLLTPYQQMQELKQRAQRLLDKPMKSFTKDDRIELAECIQALNDLGWQTDVTQGELKVRDVGSVNKI